MKYSEFRDSKQSEAEVLRLSDEFMMYGCMSREKTKYSELRDSKQSEVIEQFNQAIENKNEAEVFRLADEIMLYGFMSRPKLNNIMKKEYKTRYTKETNLPYYDYRRIDSSRILPENICFKFPNRGQITVKVNEHWIKRREASFVGDTVCKELEVPYDIARSFYGRYGRITLDEAFKNSFGAKLKDEQLSEALETAESVIYTITLKNDREYIIRELGGFVCTTDIENKKVIVRAMLKNNALIENAIDVIDTYMKLENAICSMFEKSLPEDWHLEFKHYCNYTMVGNKQRKDSANLALHKLPEQNIQSQTGE